MKYIHLFLIKQLEPRAHVLFMIVDHISKCIGIVRIRYMPSSIGQNNNMLSFNFMVVIELAKEKMKFVRLCWLS